MLLAIWIVHTAISIETNIKQQKVMTYGNLPTIGPNRKGKSQLCYIVRLTVLAQFAVSNTNHGNGFIHTEP